jgi:Viral BACON domain
MDTKRCLRCHKLLRADAQKCSLCGYVFLQEPIRRSSKATNGSRYSATASIPSNPPASPHRAGHYSGLHPEDQPYQSSFMPILRPSAITRRLGEQESGDMLGSTAVSSTPSQKVNQAEQTLKRHVASPVSTLSPMPQRSPGAPFQRDTPLPLLEIESSLLTPEPTLHEQIIASLPVPVKLKDKRQPRSRIVRILFIAAILSFLLASSILTYLVIFAVTGAQVHQAIKVVHPGSQQGQFTAPQLQLSASFIDFGAENVQNSLTLMNAGDQQVNWQAGVNINNSWLGITPTFGTFSKKETATVTVNRSNLTPQVYTGYINFFQQGTNNPLTLKVTMSVTTLAATVTISPPTILTIGPSTLPAMVITPNALTFNAIQGKNPAKQTFNLANPGNAALNWAITGDANATTLLSISPKSGTAAPGSSVPITVTPNVLTSTAGVINATLTIQDTDPGTPVKSQQVGVKIIISNQALIIVSTTSIACNLSTTNTNSTQQLQITNSGSATLNWTVLSQPLPAWISVDTTSGTLPPGYIAFVNIACKNTGFQSGTHTSFTLVVSDTDAQTPVVPQNVQVTLTVT